MSHESTDLLTVSETARALKVSKPTTYRLMAKRQLEWVQVGAHRRVTRAAIAKFIAANTEQAGA